MSMNNKQEENLQEQDLSSASDDLASLEESVVMIQQAYREHPTPLMFCIMVAAEKTLERCKNEQKNESPLQNSTQEEPLKP